MKTFNNHGITLIYNVCEEKSMHKKVRIWYFSRCLRQFKKKTFSI